MSASAERRLGRGMAWAAALGLLVLLTVFFQGLDSRIGGIVHQSGEAGSGRVVIQRDRSGHFLADGAINGRAVRFLLDTGATDVAVSERMARTLNLEFGTRVTVMTAAGPAPAWVTRLRRVTVGTLSLDNVRATITPGLGEEALLGMSFLRHFHFSQQGDTLVITHAGGRDA